MDLFLGGDLDEVHRPLAPVADGLHPDARAPLIAGLKILIVEEGPLPLHQAEAAQVGIGEHGVFKVARVLERPPQPLAPPVHDGERPRITHHGRKSSTFSRSLGPKKNMEVSVPNARLLDVGARIEHHLHRHVRAFAGRMVKRMAAAALFAVQQRMQHDGIATRTRLLDPVGDEDRKFLARRVAVFTERPRAEEP